MNGWFIAILMLYALEMGIVTAKNGEARKGKFSVGSTTVNAGIMLLLIYMAVKTGF